MHARLAALLGICSITIVAAGCSGGAGADGVDSSQADPGGAADPGATDSTADAVTVPGSKSGPTKLSVPAKISTLRSDPYVIAGYLDVRHYGAKGDGVTDDTNAFQQALYDASGDASAHRYGASMAVYVPPGTYLVSRTITGYQACNSNGSIPGNPNFGAGTGISAPSLVGPAAGARPTIVLKDGTFTNSASPKPIVHMVNSPSAGKGACNGQWQDATAGAFDILFNTVIRDINFKTGNNPGAIGVQFYSAQMSYMQNVSVDATGGYIGIQGAPATEVWENIHVTGGQIGVQINDTAGTSTVAGLRLDHQTTTGLSLGAVGAMAIAGFDIEETSATASGVSFGSRGPQTAMLSMFDGIVHTTSTNAPAIANNGDGSVYLHDTYLQSPTSMIANHSSTTIAGNGKMQLVKSYVHADLGTNPVSNVTNKIGYGQHTYSYVDGVLQTKDVGPTFGTVGTVPTDLVQRHVAPQMPWAFDSKVVWVTDYGADPTGAIDSTTAIRNAVSAAHANGGDEVFLPRGKYALTGTIVLYPNTKFFGLPGGYSQFTGSQWNTQGKLAAYVQVGDASKDATGAKAGHAIVSDLQFGLPTTGTAAASATAQTYLSAIDWQTGQSSVLNQVFSGFQYQQGLKVTPASRNVFQVRNGGGGRWFGLQIVGDWGPNGPNGHMLYVTDNAPLTLYGSNPEHGAGGSFYGFTNATDVRVLGMKVEDGSTPYTIDVESSDNVLVSGVNGDGPAPFKLHASGNVDLDSLGYYEVYSAQGHGGHPFVQDDDMSYPFNDNYALIELGTFDDSPFPRCGKAIACVP